jgi:3-dehydroquinate synthetase
VAEAVAERRVRVEAGAGRYDVIVGAGVLGTIDHAVATAARDATGIGLIADAGLPPETVATVELRLGALAPVATLTIEPSERDKSLATLERVSAHLAEAQLERAGGLVVALGGGIVGDIAGFAAASYRRGVRVVQCPTTLLAMVDASVGGKTGVNLAVHKAGGVDLRKNFVGAFHQPSLVVADVAVLDSLPERDFRCGLAECFKHGLISAGWGDPDLLDWTETATPALLARDRPALVELVARNVAVKARVVAADERETAAAGRMLLNLGHTFAHAIETMSGVSPIHPDSPAASAEGGSLRHGEAVALGLIAASRLSAALGLAGHDLSERIGRALAAAGLPTAAWGLPPADRIRAAMAHDKKAAGGKMRLVVPLPGAQATVIDEPDAAVIDAAIGALRGAEC